MPVPSSAIPVFVPIPKDEPLSPMMTQFVTLVATIINSGIRSSAFSANGIASYSFGVSSADYGDITVAAGVWTIDANVVSDTKLRQGAACTVIGRSANSTGNVADISAASNDLVLARSSNALAFQQVTYAMIQNISAQYRLLGRSSVGAGVTQEITSSATIFSFLGSADAATARAAIGVGGTGSGSIQVGVYASLPAAGASDRYYHASDSPYYFIDSGAAWQAFVDAPIAYLPTSSGWSWVNQGSATIDSSKGMLYLYSPNDAADSFKIQIRSIPSVPYTLTFRLRTWLPGADYASAGVVWRASGSGNIKAFYFVWDTNRFILGVGLGNDGTNKLTSNYLTILSQPYEWLRLVDDNTNQEYWISHDGVNWIKVYTHARNTDVTPDQYGFFVNPRNSISMPAAISLLSLKET